MDQSPGGNSDGSDAVILDITCRTNLGPKSWGRTAGLCSEDWGHPCAELWCGPMSRGLGELAEVGKVYDIRQNCLLGGLVLIVWCILL